MADEHLFTADVEGTGSPTKDGSRRNSCLTGCLIILVIFVIIAVLIGVWFSRNWQNVAATLITEVVREGMADSQLPAQEQQEIMVQIDRVAQSIREKKMAFDQFATLAQKFAQSPLISLIVASTIEQHYFAKSGLSAEEKAEGRQTLQRFVRGAIDEKINQAGFDAAMAHVADPDGAGKWKIRETLTDAELRTFLAEAKKQADAAAIPDQPAEIDPSGEIKKVVDEALAAPA